jgi:hypothetical protein
LSFGKAAGFAPAALPLAALPQEIILTHNTHGVTRCPAPTHSRRLRIAGAYPGADRRGIERGWTHAELGTPIVEATNRKPLLNLGRTRRGPKARRSIPGSCRMIGLRILSRRIATSP